MKFPFNWYNKFGTIPSSYREAMSYEEQILWLCQQIENLKLESSSYNYNMLENKPSINGVTLQGNINSSQLGLDNYNYLLNKPAINGITLLGNKTLTELDIQEKLVAGTGIRIIGNTISATGGGSGGSSDYNDLYNRPSINGIILAGDLNGREAKLQNSLTVDRSYEINDNYGKIANLASYQINDIIPINIPETDHIDASYIILNAPAGSYFEMYGNFDLYKIDNLNKLKSVYSHSDVGTGDFESLSDGTLVINFFDVGTYNAELKVYPSGKTFSQKFEEEDKNINTCKYNLQKFLEQNFDYDNLLTNAQEGYYIGMGNSDQLPELTEGLNYRHIKIPLLQNYSSVFIVNGECDSYLWFTTKVINNVEYVTSHSGLNIKTDGTLYIPADIPNEADYLYFQFSNYDNLTNVLEGLKISEISGGNASINKLTSDIILLSDTTPTLSTGLYVLANAEIYLGSASPSNVVYGKGEIIYYDSSTTTFYGDFNMVALDEGTWGITQNDVIENSLTNSRNKIPTSQAVYNAIQGGFITKISSDITLIPDTAPSLSTGLYLLENAVIYFGSAQPANIVFGKGEIIYYDSTATTLYGDFNIVALNEGTWGIRQNDIIENSLTNSRNRIPTSQAVYNAIQAGNIIPITTDILLDPQTPPALTTGLYILENAGIYRTSIIPANTLFGTGEIIYYDSTANTFYGSFIKAFVNSLTDDWDYEENNKIDVTTLSNANNKFPTSAAVYTGIIREIYNKNTYSNTEERVGTWIDGKPIYRKTVNFGNLPNNSSNVTAHGISDVDVFTKIEGIGVRLAGGGVTLSCLPIPYSGTNFIEVYAKAVNIEISTTSDRSAYTGYITLEYTKTTD